MTFTTPPPSGPERRWPIVGAARLAGLLLSLVGGAVAQGAADRTQTPLADIRGFEAPATATASASALTEHPEIRQRIEQTRALIEDRALDRALAGLDELLARPEGRGYETYHLRAVVLARLGRVEEAVQAGLAALSCNPGGVDAHFLLGGLRQRAGELDEAIRHFRAATLQADRELNNTKVTLSWLMLGQALAEAGYTRAAVEAYERFDAAIWTSHPEQRNAEEIARFLTSRPHGALELRLELLARLGQKQEAARTTAWAVDTWPEDSQVAQLHAAALLEAGQPEQAAQFCEARSQRPDFAATLLPVLIEALAAGGRLDGWIENLLGQISAGQALDLGVSVAQRLRQIGQTRQAVRVAEALVAQRPGQFEAVWELSEARWQAGDSVGALDTLIQFVRRDPGELLELPARVSAWLRTPGAAARAIEQIDVLRRRPDRDFATDYVLGVAAAGAGQAALAEELLAACTRARPDFVWGRIARVQLLVEQFDWQAARAAAQELVAAQPERAAAHYVLGLACDGLDDGPAAEQAFKTAIKLAPQTAIYKLALAERHRRVGDLVSAQRYFQEALLADPTCGPAAEGLIDSYVLDGKQELAREQFARLNTQALPADTVRRISTTIRFMGRAFSEEHLAELARQFDEHPGDAATGRLLAAGLFVWGRVEDAARVLERALAAAPDDYHMQVLQANVHIRRGDADAAIAVLERLAQRYPNRREVLGLLAETYRSTFRTQEARQVYRRLLAGDAENANLYRQLLLRSYDEFGEADAALELLDDWIARTTDPETLDALAAARIEVLIGAQRFEEALRLAIERLDAVPSDFARREMFVRAGWEAHQYRLVEKRLREWLSAAPADADLMEDLVETLLRDGRPDEAFELARSFEGDWAGAKRRRIWMARCHEKAGRTDAAISEYTALLSERLLNEAEIREVRGRLLETLIQARQFDRAAAQCDDWLRAVPDGDVEQRYALLSLKRHVLMSAGRTEEYARVMETLLEFAPDNPGLNNDLGYTWVDAGRNLQRAAEMIRRAVAEEPMNAAYLDSLGWAYYKSGEFERARLWLERARTLREGRDATIADHAGDAAMRLRDAPAAERHWREALRLLEGQPPERARPDDVELRARLRAKLDALEQGKPPPVAPTAAEQHADSKAEAP